MHALVCIDCGKGHGPATARCPCGGPLDHAQPLTPATEADLQATGPGLWRFHPLLPMPVAQGVSLGEGDTPLVRDDELGAWLKLEYANPTGSFKDRGASVTVSAAKALGATRVTEDSSGNAGAACAAYAGQAGLEAHVFSPATITAAKRARIEALGAKLTLVDGPRSGVTEAAVKAAGGEDTYYANHTYPPHFIDGCATIAYELFEAGVPDVVVTPCAMGSVLLGLHRGFSRLVAGGLLEQAPRLVAVQAAGFDPVVRALGGESGAGENRLADGLLIPDPPRLEQLVSAVRETGGAALSVDEGTTRDAMARLHRRGWLAEGSSSVTLAALERLRAQGRTERDERVALVLTGRWSP